MRDKLLKSSAYVLFSNALRLGSKFLVGVVAARVLGPTSFGFYNLVDLVNKYAPLSNLGVSSGISREIPMSLGRGAEGRAAELNDAGFTGLLLTTGGTALFIIAGSAFFYNGLAFFAITMASLTIVANAIYEYHIMYLYSYGEFRKASHVISAYSVILLVLSVSLVLLFNIWGQFTAIFVVPLATIALVYGWKVHRFSFRLDAPTYLHIVKIGLPLIVIGIGYTFLTTFDRLLIARMYDITNLGYYGLAIMVFVFGQQIPSAVSQVIYPRLNLLFGQSDRTERLAEVAILPSVLIAVCLSPLLAAFMALLPPLVAAFLPEYRNGIIPAEIIIIPIAVFEINVLNTLFRVKTLIAIIVLSIAVKTAGAFLFYKLSFGLPGIAVASCIGLLCYSVTVTVLSLRAMRKKVSYVARYLLFYVLLPLASLSVGFAMLNGYLRNPAILALPAVYYGYLGYRVFRRGPAWDELLRVLE